ncbi:MAG: hypothetical protein PCFJNLEI_00592 [Verrucomicrobiae bacterium]|nr:hypothetical protein [Verrucomicrobiae bacterium]
MKRFPWFLVVFLTSALISSGGADTEQIEHPLRLELDLIDGSRLIGIPSLEAVSVQTSYAKMAVPLSRLLTIKMGADHETATLDLRNGDQLKGVISLGPIKLETVFGQVAVGVALIRELRVALPGRALLAALREGLVLHYSFDRDEGGTVTDGSGKQNGGTVRGARWTPKGKAGGAYDFDGTDAFIELGPSRLYKATGQLSGCAWVQPRGKSAIVLSNYRGGGAYKGQFFFAADNSGVLDVIFGQDPGVLLRYITKGLEIPMGDWHHVAFSYDETRGAGQKVKFYFDGKEAGVGLIQGEGNGGPILDTADNLRIMAHRATGANTHSAGLVDEVMLFDRALQESEIQEIYESQK